jgi:hypothetical protein
MTHPQYGLDLHTGPSAALKAAMQELAHEMLLAAGGHGVGFDDVRLEAQKRGLLTGHENGRFLSFGSPCMKAAGGVVVRFRRSKHAESQRRRVAVYVHTSHLARTADPSAEPGQQTAPRGG